MSRVRENRTHGSTGGSWKRSILDRVGKKNSRSGNRTASVASRPTSRNCHRASSRPYVSSESLRIDQVVAAFVGQACGIAGAVIAGPPWLVVGSDVSG